MGSHVILYVRSHNSQWRNRIMNKHAKKYIDIIDVQNCGDCPEAIQDVVRGRGANSRCGHMEFGCGERMLPMETVNDGIPFWCPLPGVDDVSVRVKYKKKYKNRKQYWKDVTHPIRFKILDIEKVE
jgi:hypothetical protein